MKIKIYRCSKCGKKLKRLEANPNGYCDKCWGKVVDKTDMSCFDDLQDNSELDSIKRRLSKVEKEVAVIKEKIK